MRRLTTTLIPLLLLACERAPVAPPDSDSNQSPTLSTSAGAEAAVIYHSVANGPFGSVAWHTPIEDGRWSEGQLWVGRAGTVTEPETFLTFWVAECEFGEYGISCSGSGGSGGLIPNEDLKLSQGILSLHTNISENPDFVLEQGEDGVLSITWHPNGLTTARNQGVSQYSRAELCDEAGCYPGYTWRQQGTSSTRSASIAGTILGTALLPPNTSGDFGTARSVTIEMYR